MNLHKPRVFCEVVERQSLTPTVQHLVVTQPVISGHVRDLEEQFGAKLLQQEVRRMVPTEAGEIVHRYAIEVLRATDKTTNIVRGLTTGEAGCVLVGANHVPGTYILPPMLTAFRLRHPKADISLSVSDPSTVCEQMHKGKYDFAVVTESEPPPGFQIEILSQEQIVVVVSPRHRLARRLHVTLDDLRAEKFVCRQMMSPRTPVIEALLRSVGLTDRRIELSLSHSEAIKQAVEAGVGIAAMFRCSVEPEIARGALVEIPVDVPAEGPPLTLPIYLIHNVGKRLTPIQRQVLDFIHQQTCATSGIPVQALETKGIARPQRLRSGTGS